MPVMWATESRTIEAGGIVARPLAVPSRGSTELAVWQSTVAPGYAGVAHTLDREEVFVVQAGQLRLTIDGRPVDLAPGDALAVQPGEVVSVGNPAAAAATVLICSSAGVLATVGDRTIAPPWAQ